MKVLLKISLILILIVSYFTGRDSNSIPYSLRGVDVYLYNDATREEFYVDRLKGNYFSKRQMLKRCKDEAYLAALNRKIKTWSYVCCTVTHSSDCETKVQ